MGVCTALMGQLAGENEREYTCVAYSGRRDVSKGGPFG